ncbi:MAG: outer membrane lipoprotein carrier protein LolA [Rickettsiaceae bacterium]
MSYLDNLGSIAVDFMQTDSDGMVADGMLIINKPYKFRCNYYPPFPLLIVGNQKSIAIYDYDMHQLSTFHAKDNLLNFLLAVNLELDDHIKVLDVLNSQNDDNEITFFLTSSKYDQKGDIVFDIDTKDVKKITIYEQNKIISLDFDKVHHIKNINDQLFKIKNPDVFGPPTRLNKDKIQTLYTILN